MVILYQSNTGFTREYARMLAGAENLKCFEQGAGPQPPAGEEVFYMGPLMAGRVTGLDRARKHYTVRGVCGVGMSPPGEQVLSAVARANQIEDLPVFYLQGGWAPEKVSWLRRKMVGMATRSIRKALQEKGNRRTPEEERGLDFLLRGGSYVARENLAPIQRWLSGQR